MILVTLGTQKQQFARLLDLIEKSSIKDEIIVQAGHTKYESKKMKIFDFINYDEMDKLIEKADVIITHGGTGSIVTPLKKGKKIIAMARLKKYGEHVDDHQEQIVDMFSEVGYIFKCSENDNIEELINKIKKQPIKKFESNSETFIEKLKEEINEEHPKVSISNKLYLLTFVLIMLLGFITLTRLPRELSLVENRNLTYLKKFSIERYLTRAFQENLENTLSDQFVGGEKIKSLMNKHLLLINARNTNKSFCRNDYISMSKKIAIFDCSDYMLNFPSNLDLENNAYFNFRVSELNKLNKDFNMYYYIINKSDIIDFRTNKITLDLYGALKNKLINYTNISELKIKNYEQYKEYFYKTDHHWNYKGSYQGYKDIMKMFNIDNIIIPTDEIEYKDTIFHGSNAKKISYFSITEPFKTYKLLLNKHDEYIYGKERKYGCYEDFYKGNYTTTPATNYYAYYYGLDNGEVLFDFHNEEKDNLLILSSSYGNPIKVLIASHFNKTYSIDLRDYKDFNIYEYANKKNIKNILIIGDTNLYSDPDFEFGV